MEQKEIGGFEFSTIADLKGCHERGVCFLDRFEKLKEGNPASLLFFKQGNSYELYFNHALTASKILGFPLYSMGGFGEVPVCPISEDQKDLCVKILVEAGERVVIYDREESRVEEDHQIEKVHPISPYEDLCEQIAIFVDRINGIIEYIQQDHTTDTRLYGALDGVLVISEAFRQKNPW